MLKSVFHQLPAQPIWQPGMVFKVTGYARVGRYTLVYWRMGGEDEYATGESLYIGETLITSGGGRLPIWEPPSEIPKTTTPKFRQSVFDQIPKTLGKYGVPPAIARKLRLPENQHIFEVPRRRKNKDKRPALSSEKTTQSI